MTADASSTHRRVAQPSTISIAAAWASDRCSARANSLTIPTAVG